MQLDRSDHECLARWAADCAEHVLSFFEQKFPEDLRPRHAIEAARAWQQGALLITDVHAAAIAAHAAASDATTHAAACAAARAAGHAAATAHVASHASQAATFAATAAAHGVADSSDAAEATARERDWQRQQLPEHLHALAFPPRNNR
ncbi:hypothetical protein COCOR_05935 [Corallococcus coralloides DSM 2259]|uniref:Imm-5-like domain-containing protein n=1 Tax=Corallococcus coralloides (strain ATCC 25202 / DSM 2259 / NBRC 100086 / M2) TaxID=1144275 RepID=H8MIE7_CORCM|nr:hypothetical protein [Corallococcus coralloides]AFE06661.1 hypothetical protein COCOR_05935 [Corallococcus coralloides DSM 2259]